MFQGDSESLLKDAGTRIKKLLVNQTSPVYAFPSSDDLKPSYVWSPLFQGTPAPVNRHKHAACVNGRYMYIYGGRGVNCTPLKDLWQYDVVLNQWQQLPCEGDAPPSLQEHTLVAYKNSLYAFGGDFVSVMMNETPLWCYDLSKESWSQYVSTPNIKTPVGRRGHTAVVYNNNMFVYGGYIDLKGSTAELWSYEFETAHWHLNLYSEEQCPGPRHGHSAILHNQSMLLYGGSSDLVGNSDFWSWNFGLQNWTQLKSRHSPGKLHSHTASPLPWGMLLIGGIYMGKVNSDPWQFSYSDELWQKPESFQGIRMPACLKHAMATVPLTPKVISPPCKNLKCCSKFLCLRTGNTAQKKPRIPWQYCLNSSWVGIQLRDNLTETDDPSVPTDILLSSSLTHVLSAGPSEINQDSNSEICLPHSRQSHLPGCVKTPSIDSLLPYLDMDIVKHSTVLDDITTDDPPSHYENTNVLTLEPVLEIFSDNHSFIGEDSDKSNSNPCSPQRHTIEKALRMSGRKKGHSHRCGCQCHTKTTDILSNQYYLQIIVSGGKPVDTSSPCVSGLQIPITMWKCSIIGGGHMTRKFIEKCASLNYI